MSGHRGGDKEPLTAAPSMSCVAGSGGESSGFRLLDLRLVQYLAQRPLDDHRHIPPQAELVPSVNVLLSRLAVDSGPSDMSWATLDRPLPTFSAVSAT